MPENNILTTIGDAVGTAVSTVVDTTSSIISGIPGKFAAVKNTFSAVRSRKGPEGPPMAKAVEKAVKKVRVESRKQKFGKPFCAEADPSKCPSGFGAVSESSFGAVDESVTKANDVDAMRLREAAFRKAAEEAESGKWNGGNWDRLRKNVWQGQAEGNQAMSAPATYQQAILSQPIPMLSPIRGTNQPQGLRAIVDATTGTTTTTYNPNLPALAVAIPSNATAGSLSADVKVNIVGGAPASNFAALFG